MHLKSALLRIVMGGALVAGLSLTTAAPVIASAPPQVHVYVNIGPPRPIIEHRVVSPGPGYVWVSGYHRWDGHAYVWVAGSWQRPPRPSQHWVAGAWRRDSHGYYFVEGRWR